MKTLATVFKALFAAASSLSFASAALITASLFIADRRPQSGEWLGIHVFVNAAFLALGLLLAGILVQVAGLVNIAADPHHERARSLSSRISRLVILLVAGGLALCAILAIPPLPWTSLSPPVSSEKAVPCLHGPTGGTPQEPPEGSLWSQSASLPPYGSCGRSGSAQPHRSAPR